MAENTELVIKINGNIKGYTSALKSANDETEQLQQSVNRIAATGAVAFAAFAGSIGLAVKQAAKFETIQAQFETLTGSVKTAEQTIKELSDFTAKTPFQFEQVAQAAKQLLAFKIEGDALKPTLQAIGDAAAATGASFGDLTLIFGQVKAAGKLTGERLLQLEERAIPIGPALAKTMGVAETAIRDLVSKGEVDFKTFEKAFKSLSEEGGLAFEGMAKRSQTLEGQLSTLSDNFQLLTVEVGKQFLPVVKEAAGALTTFLNFLRENPGLADFIAKMLVAGTVTGALLTTGALAVTMFLKLRAAIIASTIATRGLSFAVKGLIGATGLGLLVAFLPEILATFKEVFPKALIVFNAVADTIIAKAKGLGKIFAGVFTFDIDQIKEGANQYSDAAEKAGAKAKAAFAKLEAERKKEAEATKKAQEGSVAAVDKSEKQKTDTVIQGVDLRTQKLRDENELLKAELAGQTKTELSALKKRQEVRRKELEAQAIQDKDRRAAALENIKLLNQQIDKEQADAAKKETERQRKKDEQAAQRAAKEQEQADRRINNLLNENEALSASLNDRSTKEIDFLRRRQEIRDQIREAEKTANLEESVLLLENAELKNEKLLAEEAEYLQARDELLAENREAQAAVEAELAMLSEEQRRLFREKDIEELQQSFQTKAKIAREAAKKDILDTRKEQALFLEDEKKFGTEFAKLKAFFRREDIKGAESAASQLVVLQRSTNSTLKGIGKAAALVQIAINTKKGAIAAYSALAGIPIVGPALGIAAAAALTAYGLEQARQVQGAQQGGIVAGSGFGDKVPFLLEPGELITPRQNFEEVVTAVANQRAGQQQVTTDERAAGEPQEFIFGFTEEAADFLTVQQNEQAFLGTSQRIAFSR